jgi:hypothetical protein
VPALVAALLAVQVLSGLSTAQGLLPKLWHYQEMRAEGDRLAALIDDADGQVLADMALGYLVIAHRSPIWQPFEHTSLALRGLWDQTEFIQRIQRREFALILIQPDLATWNWTPEMLEAITQNYLLVDEIANQQVYARDTNA